MPYSLLEVVYWVVKGRTLSGGKIKTYYYDDYFVDDDGVIEWHDREDHPKRKAQKAQIKKELMPIAWHPSRYWDWCMSEDEKRETEKLWTQAGIKIFHDLNEILKKKTYVHFIDVG